MERASFCLRLLAGAGLLGLVAAVGRADPQIICPNPIFDFGNRHWGDTIELSYTIKNEGDTPLKIASLWTLWTYPFPEPPAGEIAPGRSIELKVPMKMQAMYVQRLPGDLEIVSNDPKTPRLKVQFKGTLSWAVGVEPQLLEFGDVDMNKGTTKPIVLTAPDDRTRFQITRVETESTPDVQAKVEQVTPGSTYKVQVTIRAGTVPRRLLDGRPEPLQGRVLIYTDNAAVGTITVPLDAAVKGPVAVEPEGFFAVRSWSGGMGRGAPRGVPLPMAAAVRVVPDSAEVKGFKITGVEAPRNTITSEITPDGKGGYEVKLNGVVPTDDLNNTDVLIKTDLKDAPVLRVPIFVRDQVGT